jgi:glycosyltransferase involved in cell wall biosynthesis
VKISGFSFVRNASIFDYPLEESLRSLLPLCDQVVIAVGDGSDDPEAIRRIDPKKIEVIPTIWDESLREGGRIYAQQTDLALERCDGDWCIYLQADEVLHEGDYERIRRDIADADRDRNVDALLFRYLHFYGSYDYIGQGRQWYRREIRAFRNRGDVISWGDAQGFRRRSADGTITLLRARQTESRIFHYGWVKPPDIQQRKQRAAHRYWHDDEWIAQNIPATDWFDYASAFELDRYRGDHPAVMAGRIAASKPWTDRFDAGRLRPKPFLVALTDRIERLTGWRIGEYRNFIEV